MPHPAPGMHVLLSHCSEIGLFCISWFLVCHSRHLCISALPQFAQYLHENAAYVRPLEEGLQQLHQSITEDTVTTLVRPAGGFTARIPDSHTY